MNLIEELEKQADLIRNKSVTYKDITINPITCGQLIAISPHIAAILIEDEITTPEEFFNIAMPKLANYMTPIKAIINELVECDFDNLLPVDFCNIYLIILSMIDVKSFLNSTILIEKIGRNTRMEIIAAEQLCSTL